MKERIVRAVAGSLVLISILLAFFVSMNWLWLGVFVGVNLLQSSFTRYCPLEMILTRFGVKGPADRISITKSDRHLGGCCPTE